MNAEIIARTLTASLTGTVEKTYDGTVAADLLPGNFILSGVSLATTSSSTTPPPPSMSARTPAMARPSRSRARLLGPTRRLPAQFQLDQRRRGRDKDGRLTITAEGQTKVYGAAIRTLTASYSGLVNGDTPATFTTPPTLSTTASTFSSSSPAVTRSRRLGRSIPITRSPTCQASCRSLGPRPEVVLIPEPVFKKSTSSCPSA